MSWLLFDEHGNRAKRLTVGWRDDRFPVFPGHRKLAPSGVFSGMVHTLGFFPERTWRPTFFAAKLSHGYRVFELDAGQVQYIDQRTLTNLWQPASPDHKQLPTMAAVEMWIRHVGVQR